MFMRHNHYASVEINVHYKVYKRNENKLSNDLVQILLLFATHSLDWLITPTQVDGRHKHKRLCIFALCTAYYMTGSKYIKSMAIGPIHKLVSENNNNSHGVTGAQTTDGFCLGDRFKCEVR